MKVFFAQFLALLLAAAAFADFAPRMAIGGDSRDFKWQISGANGVPEKLSELKWRSVESRRMELGIDYIDGRFIASVDGGFGLGTQGEVRDSDWNAAGAEYSRSESLASASRFANFGVAAGAKFLATDRLDLTLQIAAEYSRDRYRLHSGRQIIGAGKSLAGLDSEYRVDLFGFSLRTKAAYKPQFFAGRFELGASFGAANYDAIGKWNLRDDHDRFEHSAIAYEYGGFAAAFYEAAEYAAVFVKYEIKGFRADDGTDKTIFKDGSVSEQPLKSVRFNSSAIMFGVEGKF